MNNVKTLVTLLGIGGLVYLIISARDGDVVSIATLAVLVSVALILLGVGISLVVLTMHYRREQARFAQNAKENLDIMQAMQRVQNLQNTQLLKQARQLPAPGDILDLDALQFDDAVFSELDE